MEWNYLNAFRSNKYLTVSPFQFLFLTSIIHVYFSISASTHKMTHSEMITRLHFTNSKQKIQSNSCPWKLIREKVFVWNYRWPWEKSVHQLSSYRPWWSEIISMPSDRTNTSISIPLPHFYHSCFLLYRFQMWWNRLWFPPPETECWLSPWHIAAACRTALLQEEHWFAATWRSRFTYLVRTW